MMAGKARPSRITPDVLEKEAQVLKLRRVGFTFDLIAKELGYSHASGAQKAYVNACKRIVRSDVEEIRKEEQDRLDIAQTAIWQGVLRGDVPSVSALIRIMERRARLLGLDMPTKQQIEVTNTDGNTIDAEVARLVALLDSGKASALDTSISESGTTT
jgi:predicted transcriptional regulator